ncbi:acyl-CoA carboxylase subunit epsilon [Sphaerisporangium corydalis]|uniref:Acyl-CoA carboxylase subunit epsilon n=1 Tax=Sphaerisporangium corydalis TaxID=1441875 RepID=A0ABV9ECT4_9ACTN|nr:acyl-CoA carboxylase subunit epsilon [Sphaerisporangium corydalis]
MAQDLYLKVVRGNPTPEELAALIMVLTARATARSEEACAASAWIDGARSSRPPAAPSASPDAWRVSGWAR